MPSILNFTGAGFTLQSVTVVSLGTLRVRFTQDVKLVSSVATDDGLNPSLYTLSGPGTWGIQSVGAVFLDPQSVDVYLSGLLAPGQWTLTVAATLKTPEGDLIANPRSLSFWIDEVILPDPINEGAVNHTASEIIREHLNPYLAGENWDAVIEALGTGDDWNWEGVQRAVQSVADQRKLRIEVFGAAWRIVR